MIPPEAIKPIISKGGRDYTKIAVEIALAYRIFSFAGKDYTQKYREAEKIVATRNQWVSPSNLPEYYDGIDSHLNMGKDTEGIIAIRRQLKEFYGLSSAGTEVAVDTRTVTLEVLPPAPVSKKVNHPKLRSHLRRASNYQGADRTRYAPATRYILDFESDIDKAIYHTKKVTGSPTTAFKEGIRNWLSVITGLDYNNDDNRNEINNYRQKILDYIKNGLKTNNIKKTKKIGSDTITLFVPTIYDGPFTHIDKTEDQIKDEHNKEVEEVKKLFNKNINHPKLYEEIGIINTMYSHGGTFERINFRSDIDKAIYFSIKGGKSEGEKKQQVREWLFQVTGLQISDPDLTKYREKIINVIRIVLKYELDENYRKDFYVSEIPIVYNGYYQDPDDGEDDEDEEYDDDEEEDNEEYDDLYGSNLDDLLSEVREDQEKDQDQKQVIENIEEEKDQKQVIENIKEEIVDAAEDEEDEGDIGSADDIPDELLQEDVDPKLVEKLLVTINKPKKQSSYTSNKKIFDSINANFGRLQATLDVVNNNLEKQNSLIKASIDSQLAVGELITNQTDMLGEKFDILLQHFERQNNVAEQQQENEKNKLAEGKLEAQRDAAGVSDFQDLTKGPQKKKRENKIEKYLKSRLTKKLYRKLPKSVRKARQKVRKLQRLPGKLKSKATNKIVSMLPSKGKQAIGMVSKIRGGGGVGKLAGPARYAFAGLEYAERKAEGQSEVQALSGVGGGLAGAAAGGKAGAIIGAKFGLLLGPKGAAVGAIIGGLAGSIAGGVKGSEFVDKFTGADQVTGEHETGAGLTKPGTAILHGTEAVIPRDAVGMSPMNTLGGVMLASTTQFINSAGAVAAPIAPTFKGMAAQMATQYDVPSTVVQTNVGGSLPSLDKELKKVREKRQQTPEEELKGIEKDLLETQDPESFADKLLKIIDPEGKFQELLKKINSGKGDTDPGDFDFELIGDGAFDTGLRTGPSEVIGGSAAYHQDLSFGPGVSIEDQRKLILQLAVAYDKVGRKLELSNAGVGGRVFPIKGSKEEQISWIEDARAAHRARSGGTGRDAIDFYTPLKNETRFGTSVENTPILAPVIEGGQRSYFSGGAGGAGISLTKDGKEIIKIIHGRTDIPLPKGGDIPSIPKSVSTPNLPPQVNQQTTRQTNKPESISSVVSPPQNNNVASITNLNNQISNNFISSPPQRQQTIQKTMEIASLSYDTEEQNNNMLLINNQQPQGSPMPVDQSPMIIDVGGKSTSEILKNILLQRLSA